MHRNTVIAVCAAFCTVAIVAGWIVAGMSSPGGAGVAMQPTTGSTLTTPTQPKPAPTAPPATESAPTPTPLPDPASPMPTPTTAPTAEPTAEPIAGATQPAFIEYTVQKGDLLYTIAVAHDVTLEEILAVNEIPNPESLSVGQVIRIPRS